MSPRLKIRQLVHEYQIYNFAVAVLGRGAGGVLNCLFVLIAAKLLRSELFGLFSLAITVMHIALQFAGQGIDTVLVRFYVSHVQQDSHREYVVLRACLQLRFLLTLMSVAAGILLSETYVRHAGRPDLRLPLIVGLAGCGVASFWYYFLAVLQAMERYTALSLLAFAVNLVKIILLALLFAFNNCTLSTLLSAYIAPLAFGTWLAVLLVPRESLTWSRDAGPVVTSVMRYGRWVILSSLISILYSRVDILILSASRDIEEIGLYSAAGSLTNVFDILLIALLTVFLPNASKITNYSDTMRYMKFSATISLVVVLALLVPYAFSNSLIRLVLGDSYSGSIALFQIIFPGLMVYVVAFPWALIIYSYNKPHLLFLSDAIVFCFSLLAGITLIPAHGMFAASWINFGTRILNAIIIVVLVVVQSRALRADASLAAPDSTRSS